MISITPEQLDLLRSPDLIIQDLWYLTLVSGPVLRFVGAEADLSVEGEVFMAAAISRGHVKLVLGLETDTLDVTLAASTGQDMWVGDYPLRQAAQRGVLDGAAVQLDHLVQTPDRTMSFRLRKRFVGSVGQQVITLGGVTVTAVSALQRLDLKVPTALYGAPCRFQFGDQRCGVNRAALTLSGVVLPGSSAREVMTSVAAADHSLSGGVLLLQRGAMAFRAQVADNIGGQISLRTAVPAVPQSGDMVLLTPGCDKSLSTLTGCGRFSDPSLRFGGCPYIPAPEMAL